MTDGTRNGDVVPRIVSRYGPALVDIRLPVPELRLWVVALGVRVPGPAAGNDTGVYRGL